MSPEILNLIFTVVGGIIWHFVGPKQKPATPAPTPGPAPALPTPAPVGPAPVPPDPGVPALANLPPLEALVLGKIHQVLVSHRMSQADAVLLSLAQMLQTQIPAPAPAPAPVPAVTPPATSPVAK